MNSKFTSFLFLLFCFTANAQRVDTVKCGFISAGKLKVYYCERGQGPAVVLLHAGFLDMQQWKKEVSVLSKDHRVITMDLPGHGLSTGVDTVTTISKVIDVLVNQLQVSNATFIGISLGSSCVIDYALDHPQKIKKLVLCSPGLNGWQDVLKMDTLSKKLFMRPDTFVDTQEPEPVTRNFVHYWLDGPYRDKAPVDTAVRGYIYRTALAKITTHQNSGPLLDKRKAAKRIRQIRKPVMILYGSLDIPFTANVARYLQKNIRGSKIKIVQNAAHFFNFEKPGEISAVIDQ